MSWRARRRRRGSSIGSPAVPKTGRGAVCWIALVSMLVSLIHWGLSSILGSLLARALGRREAARHGLSGRGRRGVSRHGLGLGDGFVVFGRPIAGESRQHAAVAARDHGRHSVRADDLPVAVMGADGDSHRRHAGDCVADGAAARRRRASLGITESSMPCQSAGCRSAARGPANGSSTRRGSTSSSQRSAAAWLAHEFATKGASAAISSLNTYNFLFLMLGLLLCWRPRIFLDAVAPRRAERQRRARAVSVLRRNRAYTNSLITAARCSLLMPTVFSRYRSSPPSASMLSNAACRKSACAMNSTRRMSSGIDSNG